MIARIRKQLSGQLSSASRALARRGIVWPWSMLASRGIERISTGPKGNRIRLLMLSHKRFMSDVRILAEHPDFDVVVLHQDWQGRVNQHLAGKGAGSSKDVLIPSDCVLPMTNFVRNFLQRNEIDVVVSACIWYRQDVTFGAPAQQLGIPYVVLHRESLKTRPRHHAWMTDTVRRFGDKNGFLGHTIIFHNQPMCDLMARIGYAGPERTLNGGCLRMDELVHRVHAARKGTLETGKTQRRQQVAMFSFAPGIGLNDLKVQPFPQKWFLGWFRLFERSHAAIAELAREMPDVDFIIKPKWEGYWIEWVKQAILAAGIDPETLPNLTITTKADPHDLVLDSDVICGFASTCLLEAGIAGKPVVVPDFEEAVEPLYRERVQLLDYYHLFDAADSPEAFRQMVKARLADPAIDAETMRQRDAAFDEWVSDIEGNALDKYTQALREAAEWGRLRRAAKHGASNVAGAALTQKT